MAITHSYVDYGAGNDTTGDGTVATPWKTIQKALDTLTRNTTDGNQINVKAGTAHVNAAALDLTTFVAGGALSATAPLILRGYTAAANDGGIGEIDCGGAAMFAAGNSFLILVHLKIHNGAAGGNIVVAGSNLTMLGCEIVKGTSNATYGIYASENVCVAGCWVHGAISNAIRISSGVIANNYIADFTNRGVWPQNTCSIVGNVMTSGSANFVVISTGAAYLIERNVMYATSAATTSAISISTSTGPFAIANNIICGFSGAGGTGVGYANGHIIGFNAFWNNTANYAASDQTWIDKTAFDVALGADPFTDAANGDFSLTTAGKTALRSLGWPSSYPGAHANTDAHITIGPLQYGPAVAGGGRPAFGDRTGGKF